MINNYYDYIYIHIYIYIYIYIYCVKHSPIGLNLETLCFREINELSVFDFKTCDDFSVNIKFPSADQNRLWRRTCWLLHFSLVLLKLFVTHASFAIFFLKKFRFSNVNLHAVVN